MGGELFHTRKGQSQFLRFVWPHSPLHRRLRITARPSASVPSCGPLYRIWEDASTEHSKQAHDNISTSPIHNQELLDQLLAARRNIALPSTQNYHPMIVMCPFPVPWGYIEVPHEHSGAVAGFVKGTDYLSTEIHSSPTNAPANVFPRCPCPQAFTLGRIHRSYL